VFVAPVAGGAQPTPVSTGGGAAPDWRPDGGELYFLSLANRLMAVRFTVTAGSFTVATPVPLFPINARGEAAGQLSVTGDRPYALAGDRFLVVEAEADPGAGTINVVLNWTTPTAR
jgi:hypothetical protein